MSAAEMMDLVAGRFLENLSAEAPRRFMKGDSAGYRSNTQELIADGITVDSDLFRHSFDESFLGVSLPEKRIAASYSYFPQSLAHFKSASLPATLQSLLRAGGGADLGHSPYRTCQHRSDAEIQAFGRFVVSYRSDSRSAEHPR